MLIEFIPTFLLLIIIGSYIYLHRGLPIIQIYTLIMVSYLNIFPALNYYLNDGEGMSGFFTYQSLIIIFFQLPVLLITHFLVKKPLFDGVVATSVKLKLSLRLPFFLMGLLAFFWFVALHYDLYIRRLGHEGLLENTEAVPSFLLYLYRLSVETSFFIVIYILTILRHARSDVSHYLLYKITLIAYVLTYAIFFIVNSRMQFMLLAICMICTQPNLTFFFFKGVRILRTAIILLALALGLTIFRELFLEDNGRIFFDDLPTLLLGTFKLIAARLDSTIILYQLHEVNFNFLGFNFSGLERVFSLYSSFFTDYSNYVAIKASLVTSPSVEIVNQTLGAAEVDFPKSVILDMFLSLGVTGLLLSSLIIGVLISTVQNQILKFRNFTFMFLVSLYLLPMLLEFEKEFIGLFFAFLKWLPFLLLLYYERPQLKFGSINAK